LVALKYTVFDLGTHLFA